MSKTHLQLEGLFCVALSGLSEFWVLNPGLAPWAFLLDPSGVPGFANRNYLGRE